MVSTARHLCLGILAGVVAWACSSSGTGADPPSPGRGMRLAPRDRAAMPVEPRAEPMAAPRVEDERLARMAAPPPPARPPDALERLRATLAANPTDNDTRAKLARLLADQGDLRAAQAELEVLLKSPAHAQAARVLKSRIHRSVNENDAAVRWGRQAVQGDPKDPDARLHLGLALLAVVERSAAAAQLEEGVKLAPDRADLRQAQGKVFLQWNKNREAVAALREACRLAPANPAPVVDLGDAYWALGLLREAEESYKRAVNLTTGAPVFRAIALDKLGTLYNQRGFKGRARQVLEACRQLFPHLGCPYTEVVLLPPNPIHIPGAAPVIRY